MLWGYDIETEAWEHFVFGAAISERGDVVTMRSNEDVRDWVRMLGSDDTVVAHNGGSYDYIHLLSVMSDQQWTGRLAGGGIAELRLKGGPRFVDSFMLFHESLDSWTGLKAELDLPCVCERDCGGYCSIKRRGMSRTHWRRMVEYCVRDVRAVLQRYPEDVDRLAADGWKVRDRNGRVRLTLGSVAWATAADLAGITDVPTRGEYRVGRRAYFGGHCEVGRVGASRVERYDMHAAYPWALTLPVPHGRMRMHAGPMARLQYGRDPLGQYHATIDIPDTTLPPAPHRHGERANRPGRLLWTTGRVTAWWTGIELRNAEKHGARIVSLDRAVTWSDADPLYEPYVRQAYDVRDRARDAGDDRWAAIVKWYANALSGKLAQRPIIGTLHVNPPGGGGEGWEWLGGDAWIEPGERLSKCARPHQAAVLTSRVRATLLDRLARHESSWAYCDTDSSYLLEMDDQDVHPSRLGAWGYEGHGDQWDALAPKVYEYHDGDRWKVRAKGVPLPSKRRDPKGERAHAIYQALRRGETISDRRGVERVRTAGARFVARDVKRTMRTPDGWCGGRTVDSDGRTWPLRRRSDGEYETRDGVPVRMLSSGPKREPRAA